MNRNIVKFAVSTAFAVSLLFPGTALAEAGKAIFVYGKASVISATGERRALSKGVPVESGDTIVTSSNGRVQLQMADGGLLALRPGTEFLIEDFQMNVAGSGDGQSLAPTQRSFFALLKGGFRSITGAIGKENKSAYRVRTPIATIGIRGTDYDALYCAGDCQEYARATGAKVADGLYVGVNSGGIRVATDAGSLELEAGDFGFAANAAVVPNRDANAADVLSTSTSGNSQTGISGSSDSQADVAEAIVDDTPVVAEPDTGLVATDASGNEVDLNSGSAGQAGVYQTVSAYPGNSSSSVNASDTVSQQLNSDGDLVAFTTADTSVSLVTTSPVNVGRDTTGAAATGLSWGRWADAEVAVTIDGNTTNSVIDGSMHYVTAAEGNVAPVLPTTGSTSFDLVGNTNPTDNRGNVGTLGSANLSADFTSQTVDADVSLSFQETNEVWNASAQEVDINSSNATFGGDFDTVTVSDANGTAAGEGDLSGFFTSDQNGDLNGAGMTFSLSEGETEVNGATTFRVGGD